LAETPLVTLWLLLPTLTPGLMFAEALTSLFAIPTLAPIPTFGFTLSVEDPPEVEGVLAEVADCCVEVAD
jgi:hypothetical protein